MKKETIKERSHAAINALLEGITQEQLSEVSSTEGMAASALIRANQSRKEAEELLSLDNPIELTSGNEALPPEVEDPREDEFYGIRETLKPGASFINLAASCRRLELLENLNCLDMAIDAAESINARNSLEKMLIHQATACHYASMLYLNWAIELSNRNHIFLSKNHVEIQTKWINASSRLMNNYNRSLQTLRRLRTGDNQIKTGQYLDNINVVVELDLDADPVISAVRELMSETEIWKSSPTELLNTLESYVPEKIQKSRAWPKRPNILSLKLKRASSFLKTEGIEIATGLKESKGERKIEIRKINKNSAPCATNNQNKDKILI